MSSTSGIVVNIARYFARQVFIEHQSALSEAAVMSRSI